MACIVIEDNLSIISKIISVADLPISTKEKMVYDSNSLMYQYLLISKKEFYSKFAIDYTDDLPDVVTYNKLADKHPIPDISITNNCIGEGKHFKIRYENNRSNLSDSYQSYIAVNGEVKVDAAGIYLNDLNAVHIVHLRAVIRTAIIDMIKLLKPVVKPTLAVVILEQALEKLQLENNELKAKLQSISTIIQQ